MTPKKCWFLLPLFFNTYTLAADEQLYEMLRENGNLTKAQYNKLLESSVKPSSSDNNSFTNISLPSQTVQISNNGSLQFNSVDGAFKYQIGGHVLSDVAFHLDDQSDLPNGTNFRKVKPFIKGKFFDNWHFIFNPNFSSGDVNLEYANIAYTGFENTVLRLGVTDEVWGLENWSSEKYTTFVERSMINALCLCDFRMSFGYNTWGTHWSFATGIYGDNPSVQSSDDEGYGFSGRFTYAPIHENAQVLHFGASGLFRSPKQGDNSMRIAPHPESHITTALLDTGPISAVDYATAYSLEFASVYGPFSLQSELMQQQIYRQHDSENLRFNGFYIYANWFLTGESRHYDSTEGIFGHTTPKHPLHQGGIGAWEIGLRYSYLDLTDNTILGGQEDNLTFGLNWHPNNNLIFKANVIMANTDHNAVIPNDDPLIFLFRFQFEF